MSEKAVCICMPQVECPLHPDAAPTPEGVVLGAEVVTRDRMALYGYTPEQIKAAEDWPGHEAAGCFYENWQWVCTDENDKPNHPDRDELERTAEFVAWVLEREAARLAAERAAYEGHPYAKPAESDAEMFIQWKGTSVCLDFYCTCGAHGHLDDSFAYNVRCPSCGAVYEMGTQVIAKRVLEPTGACCDLDVQGGAR